MTAIYAFSSTGQRRSAIAADDLMLPYKARTDKILLLDRRFAVGISGADIAFQALEILRTFQDRPDRAPAPDIATLAQRVLDVTRRLSEVLYQHYENSVLRGFTPREAWAAAKRSDVGIVILDCREHHVYTANLGKPFPASGLLADPVISAVPTDTLLRDALARKAYGAHTEALPETALKDPVAYLRKTLDRDRGVVSQLGELGTMIFVDGDDIDYRPCLRTPEEYVREILGKAGVTGYNINVY